MRQHDGPAARVVARVGEAVDAGQIVGRAEASGAVNVHAPLSGRITALARVDTARALDVPAVEIDLTAAPGAGEMSAPAIATAASRFTAGELADLADDAGIVNPGHPARPLGALLREAAAVHVSDVIVSGLQPEPMLTADWCLLAEHLEAIISAGTWVRHAVGARHVWLALDREDREQVTRCRSAAHRTPIRVVALDNKYPQADPILLTQAILGRETPYGQSTLAAHVLVLDLSVLPALAAAGLCARPMVDRLVTVTGPAAARTGCYRIPVGTPFADVLRHVGLRRPVARVIDGGPMTGQAVESLQVVVTKQTSAILLVDRDAVRTPRPGPCVRCGWCQEDCPVGLDPRALLEIMERNELTEAHRHYAHACIECGLCSYVCPAELPLADAAARVKRMAPIAS